MGDRLNGIQAMSPLSALCLNVFAASSGHYPFSEWTRWAILCDSPNVDNQKAVKALSIINLNVPPIHCSDQRKRKRKKTALSGLFSVLDGGPRRNRTDDLLNGIQALFQKHNPAMVRIN